MIKLLNIVKFFAVLLPVIIELMKQFEVPGNGEEKKKAVLEGIALFCDEFAKLATLPLAKATILLISGKIIDFVVAVFNLLGIFKHSE